MTMKKLPLYDEEEMQSLVGQTDPIERDKKCERCALHEGVRTVCLPADGEPGGVLVVSEKPGRIEDDNGRPMWSTSGRYVRGLVAKWWKGPAAFDTAIRCAPGRTKIKPAFVKACRPFLADVMREVDPVRIVCLGGGAVESVLGRRLNLMSVRKGYAFHRRQDGTWAPIYFSVTPEYATRNRFMRQAFEEDLKWALTAEPAQPDFNAMGWLVDTAKDAEIVYKHLVKKKWYAYDVETSGEMHNKEFRLESVSLGPEGSRDVYIWTREALHNDACREWLRRILQHDEVGTTTSNGKYDDRSVLLDLKANVQKIYADTRLMSRMLDPQAAAKLDVIAERIGLGGHKRERKEETDKIKKELNRWAKPQKTHTPTGKLRVIKPPLFPIEDAVLSKLKAGGDVNAYMYRYCSPTVLYRYNGRDADVTRQYVKKVEDDFDRNPDIRRMWNEVVKDANKAIRFIEHWGVAADTEAIGAFSAYCKMQVDDFRSKLSKYGEFNPNYAKDVARILFDELELPRLKLTDGGADATDKEVLEKLKGKHPIVEVLINYRKYSKLDGTYATGMIPHVRDDGRIHASFLLDGAGTGRLSSADPNLQNIPRAKGSPDAKMARNCFVAPKGYVLLESDFSQLELRVAAMLSGDPNMIDDFKKGIDIHMNGATLCCEVAFGIPRSKWDKMTKEERDPFRSRIKTTIFGKLYGKMDKSLAREFGCSVHDVAKINSIIWGRYKRLDGWTKERLSETRRTGEAWTWWRGHRGRRRPLWGVADPEDGVRENAERSSWNTPIQGTAAEFCTASLWPITEWILEEGVPAKLVLTVHDSIIVECKKSVASEVAGFVKETMEGHEAQGMPIKVDQKWGEAWGSLEDYPGK